MDHAGQLSLQSDQSQQADRADPFSHHGFSQAFRPPLSKGISQGNIVRFPGDQGGFLP